MHRILFFVVVVMAVGPHTVLAQRTDLDRERTREQQETYYTFYCEYRVTIRGWSRETGSRTHPIHVYSELLTLRRPSDLEPMEFDGSLTETAQNFGSYVLYLYGISNTGSTVCHSFADRASALQRSREDIQHNVRNYGRYSVELALAWEPGWDSSTETLEQNALGKYDWTGPQMRSRQNNRGTTPSVLPWLGAAMAGAGSWLLFSGEDRGERWHERDTVRWGMALLAGSVLTAALSDRQRGIPIPGTGSRFIPVRGGGVVVKSFDF